MTNTYHKASNQMKKEISQTLNSPYYIPKLLEDDDQNAIQVHDIA